MNLKLVACAGLVLALVLLLAGCERNMAAKNPQSAENPPVQITEEEDSALLRLEHPEQYSLATAAARTGAQDLSVTGVVAADVSRSVPVVSMSSGRIVEIRARLGDTVQKGQVLMTVQSADIADAFADYRGAVADEKVAVAQLARSKVLVEKGAIAQKDLEVVQQTEEKADVAVETALERLRVLGADKDHPTAFVNVVAPVSGVITDQQVTAAAGTQGLASPGAFTISDLSRVWILCDVHEDELALAKVGEDAEIRLNAYPGRIFKGRVSNIGPILDPNMRTAKVRIELDNPGMLRLGMFVEATFHGPKLKSTVVLPASAILHLHDRDWVYVQRDTHTFRRVEVRGGRMLPPDRQEIVSGVRPGDRVIADALMIDNTSAQ